MQTQTFLMGLKLIIKYTLQIDINEKKYKIQEPKPYVKSALNFLPYMLNKEGLFNKDIKCKLYVKGSLSKLDFKYKWISMKNVI